MTNLYPGMIDSEKEYFLNEDKVYLIHNGVTSNFDDVKEHIELETILQSEIETNQILTEMVGKNQRTKIKKLAACRFGGLNFTADFNKETHSDFHNCPMRGKCIGENIVCKSPAINGETITIEDVRILREIAGDDKNTTIANKLGMPLGTFFVKKDKLYKLLHIPTKQRAALFMFKEGLL